MIDWWWLLIACPISAIAGMLFTGTRWRRSYLDLQRLKYVGPNPYKADFVNADMARAYAEAVDLVRGKDSRVRARRRGVQ